jgi:hypothetical protein
MVPRMTIRTLMILIIVVAIDLVSFPEVYPGSECDGGTGCCAAGMLLMVQILALGPVRILLRGGRRPPFVLGFATLGMAAVIIYWLLFIYFQRFMLEVIDYSGQPISAFCERFLPASGSVRWFSTRVPERPSMIWYHFQSQPDAIEPWLNVLFLVLVTTPVSMAQVLIASAGGLAAHLLSRRERIEGD